MTFPGFFLYLTASAFLYTTFTIPAHAADGNALLSDCQKVVDNNNGVELDEKGKIQSVRCIAYLSGFGGADALSPLKRKGKRMFCIPKSVTLNESAESVVDWMQKNTDKLHFGRHEVLAMALIVNFPCRTNQ